MSLWVFSRTAAPFTLFIQRVLLEYSYSSADIVRNNGLMSKQLLLVIENTLLLCSLLGFNKSKHILLNIPANYFGTIGEENQGNHLHRMTQNDRFNNFLGFL